MTTFPGAWHAVVEYLRHTGLSTVFGLPGDDLAVLRAMRDTDIRMVLCRDQRNAVFMAAGYALQSGGPSVCVVGKGPAAANMITGLVEARSGCAPVVVLAGGTAADRRGSGAFQELDQVSMVTPVVKWAHRVDDPSRVGPALEKAFLAATSGVPGPVYLELPDHLASLPVELDRPWSPHSAVLRTAAAAPLAGQARAAVLASRQPILLLGGGMRHRNGGRVLERFAETLGAAIYCTASGRGVVSERHALFCGLAGLYTPPGTQDLWRETDLVIAVGSRLEETATMGWPDRIGSGVPVVQINADPLELSTEYGGHRVVGDGTATLAAWAQQLAEHSPSESWQATIARCRDTATATTASELARMRAEDQVHVAEVLAAIDATTPADRVLVQENGLQDMWSYFSPYYVCGEQGGSVVPSEQTTLGFGAAAAAGVRLAAPDRPVVALVGDGAFNMFRSDLGTVRRYAPGVLYVVLHNGGYGWLHAQLANQGLDPARFPFAADPPPDGPRVTAKGDLEPALREAWNACARGEVATVFVDVHLTDTPPGIDDIDGDFPNVATGSTLTVGATAQLEHIDGLTAGEYKSTAAAVSGTLTAALATLPADTAPTIPLLVIADAYSKWAARRFAAHCDNPDRQTRPFDSTGLETSELVRKFAIDSGWHGRCHLLAALSTERILAMAQRFAARGPVLVCEVTPLDETAMKDPGCTVVTLALTSPSLPRPPVTAGKTLPGTLLDVLARTEMGT
ncbi:acetolactate synthase-1/2/3 large subunit [Kibdelosporangium banguiense]|uniref:Acetolactate synthase-1/2/3 large subunit n=1 Tax=Kibdelosporangium banguiense TaxID=1365924 RepID=A0ABS4U1Y9_9PSEU|nr:thiamine pyrophosphate-binding protein [Kibdelosporangium banguiense]MBP2330652.1 acetolactate synthase-1/2/3 large subunit [Kibdelosporangium banguiense]